MNTKNKKIFGLIFLLAFLGLLGKINSAYAGDCSCSLMENARGGFTAEITKIANSQQDCINFCDNAKKKYFRFYVQGNSEYDAGFHETFIEGKTHCNCFKERKLVASKLTSTSDECNQLCSTEKSDTFVSNNSTLNQTNNSKDANTPTSSGAFSYTPMEAIPGFEGKTNDFPSYVLALYKFGLWTIGIAAVLMISIGGYMYLTSAGNNSSVEKAKSIITDALIGFVLAMVSWLILYIINPDLVSFTSLNQVMDKAARSYDGTYPVITNDMPKDCNAQEWQDLFSKVSQSSGIDKCALQALAAIESGCNKVPSRTQGGRDCSVVQIAAHDNCQNTCEDLEANPQKALECGARYLNKCSSNYRTNNEEQKLRDMYAGYNGGCGALSSSNSCSGMTNSFGNPYMKWDCPKDCGGYCPVPARTSVFLNYYNQCKNK